MVEYDAAVIKKHAERLYAQTAWLQFSWALSWAVIAFVVVYLVLRILPPNPGMHPATFAFILAALAAIVGYSSAGSVAQRLRLEAQTALCQVQIEHNTSHHRPRGDEVRPT